MTSENIAEKAKKTRKSDAISIEALEAAIKALKLQNTGNPKNAEKPQMIFAHKLDNLSPREKVIALYAKYNLDRIFKEDFSDFINRKISWKGPEINELLENIEAQYNPRVINEKYAIQDTKEKIARNCTGFSHDEFNSGTVPDYAKVLADARFNAINNIIDLSGKDGGAQTMEYLRKASRCRNPFVDEEAKEPAALPGHESNFEKWKKLLDKERACANAEGGGDKCRKLFGISSSKSIFPSLFKKSKGGRRKLKKTRRKRTKGSRRRKYHPKNTRRH